MNTFWWALIPRSWNKFEYCITFKCNISFIRPIYYFSILIFSLWIIFIAIAANNLLDLTIVVVVPFSSERWLCLGGLELLLDINWDKLRNGLGIRTPQLLWTKPNEGRGVIDYIEGQLEIINLLRKKCCRRNVTANILTNWIRTNLLLNSWMCHCYWISERDSHTKIRKYHIL